MFKTIGLAVVLVFIAILLGCTGTIGSGGAAIYVHTTPLPPPPPISEPILFSPGPEFAWISGHYSWNGTSYFWVPGHYERHPFGRHVWLQGYWGHNNRGWYWTEGHWN